MGLVGRFKQLVQDKAEDETYEYRCTVCQGTFESSESHMGKVSCKHCGATDVRSAVMDSS